MPQTIMDDISSKYRGIIKINGNNEEITETYDLKVTDGSWATAVSQLLYIASWRGAILGSDASVDYAVVCEVGPSRKSKVAIEHPIRGTTGVKFDYTGAVIGDSYLNTLATGLRFRFETDVGDHYTRKVRGVCDAYISRRRWIPSTGQADVFDVGPLLRTEPNIDLDSGSDYPLNKVWDFFKTPAYTTAEKNQFVTYEVAWQYYLRGVYHFTSYKKQSFNSDGTPNVGVYTNTDWADVVYRKVGDKAAGLPSMR